MAAEDALNQLIDAGLQPGERTDAFDDEVPAGAIVSTTPEAGTEVAPGTTVDYLVSSGPEPTPTPEPTPELVTVPNLRGEDSDDAVNVLLWRCPMSPQPLATAADRAIRPDDG